MHSFSRENLNLFWCITFYIGLHFNIRTFLKFLKFSFFILPSFFWLYDSNTFLFWSSYTFSILQQNISFSWFLLFSFEVLNFFLFTLLKLATFSKKNYGFKSLASLFTHPNLFRFCSVITLSFNVLHKIIHAIKLLQVRNHSIWIRFSYPYDLIILSFTILHYIKLYHIIARIPAFWVDFKYVMSFYDVIFLLFSVLLEIILSYFIMNANSQHFNHIFLKQR